MFYSVEQIQDKSIVAELKSKYGPELRAVVTPLGVIVFKKPVREAFDRWQDKSLTSKASSAADARELCQECFAGCTLEEFRQCIDDKPGLLQGEFMSAILEMAGAASEKFEVKKL